jgi:hypothetical protein
MAKFHETYLGSGDCWLRKRGSEAPLAKLANVNAVSFSGEEEVKEARGGKGNAKVNELRRVSNVSASITFLSFSAHELAVALRASVQSIVGDDVVDETHVAYKGGLLRLAYINPTAVVVEAVGGGTTYTAGTDYEVTTAGIVIPETSTIPAPTNATTPNIQVSYSYGDQDVIEALTQGAEEYELVFDGLNEAESNLPVVIDVWRFKPGIIAELALFGDEFGENTIEAALLADTTKPVGKSQYYRVIQAKA